MQIVIEIDENLYTRLFDNGDTDAVDMLKACVAIRKGIPLPEGHGRRIILSEDAVKREQVPLRFSCQNWISEVGLSNATVAIIKADAEEKKGCSNCKFWCLDKNDENRRCKYCYCQDEWQAESEDKE